MKDREYREEGGEFAVSNSVLRVTLIDKGISQGDIW